MIVAWWRDHYPEAWPDHPQQYDWNELLCWACERQHGDLSANTLERSHLMDHALGGPDEPSNLVLLCHKCNRFMPSFGDRLAALDWVRCTPRAYDVDLLRLRKTQQRAKSEGWSRTRLLSALFGVKAAEVNDELPSMEGLDTDLPPISGPAL
jgi:hypothetical protein